MERRPIAPTVKTPAENFTGDVYLTGPLEGRIAWVTGGSWRAARRRFRFASCRPCSMAVCACSWSPGGLAIIVAVPAVLIAGVVVAHHAAAP